MKLEQLTYFLEAAKHEHIGKAAKVLNISPSAVSHSISALEEELGRELFAKRGKRICLTEHGKLLSERARKLLDEAEAIREDLRADRLELRGHYRLAATHTLCSSLLVPAWAALRGESPRVTSEIFTLRSSQVVAGVLTGEYDLGICFNPQPHVDLDQKPLHQGALVIALRREHPVFRLQGDKRWSAIASYPAVLPKSFQGIDVCERHPVFEKFHILPKPACLVDSYEVAVETAAATDFWSFLPDRLVEENKEKLRVATPPQGWDASYSITAVWPKGRPLGEGLKGLLGRVSAMLGK